MERHIGYIKEVREAEPNEWCLGQKPMFFFNGRSRITLCHVIPFYVIYIYIPYDHVIHQYQKSERPRQFRSLSKPTRISIPMPCVRTGKFCVFCQLFGLTKQKRLQHVNCIRKDTT